MKNIRLGKATIPLEDYASQGNAILGIRDSGKSYTATSIGEQLMDAGIPILAFDPIGIWRYLRVPGAGKGYKVVVAGGQHGDLPLTARGAQEIVRAAMRENVSLVIDLYDIRLSKADWREIVGSSIRTLLYENGGHGLRHIFIEEAAEFCPQNVAPDQGRVYAEVEKLARMGGNALLGYTLINQRAEQVNKAVLELCDCLILHRQKGRNSINALSKWLDVASVAGGSEIIKSLPALAQGECWVWPAGSDTPVRTKVPPKNSFHPDRRARQASPRESAAEVDVSAFVKSMKGSLEALTKEAEANDPTILRKRNAELEAQMRRMEGSQGATPDALNAEYTRGRDEGWGAREAKFVKDMAGLGPRIFDMGVKAALTAGKQALDGVSVAWTGDQMMKGLTTGVEAPEYKVNYIPPAVHRSQVARPAHKEAQRELNALAAARLDGSPPIPRAQQKILEALAYLESIRVAQPSRTQLALWADVSPTSGGYFNNLGALRSAGLIEYPSGGTVALTDAGRERAPTPAAMSEQQMQSALLQKVGTAKANILIALLELYPKDISRDDLAAQINVSPTSGGYFNNLGALRTLGVLDYPSPGRVVALPVLFLHG